jgi:hypothetical protein
VAAIEQQNISFWPQDSIGKVRSWRSTTMSSEYMTPCLNLQIMHVTFMEIMGTPTTHYQCKTFEPSTEQVKKGGDHHKMF